MSYPATKSVFRLLFKTFAVILGISLSFFVYTRIKDPAYIFKNFNRNSIIEIPTDRSYDRYFVPVMISKLDFDALIVGSSMVANLLSSKMNETFNVQSLNTSMNGSCLYEQHKLLLFALSQKKINTVFWGIDLNSLGLPYQYIAKEISYPEYLFSANKLSRFLYCLDINTNRFNVKTHEKITVENFNSWQDPENISADTLLINWENKKKDKNKTDFTGVICKQSLTAKQKYAIDRNIVSLIKKNTDCTFYLFFPPYSILELENLASENQISLILSCKDYLVERLCNAQNVYIFDFTADETITHNLNNYVDFIHYRNSISDLIIHTLKDKKNTIDYPALVENNKKLFMQLKSFNIDTLKQK